MVLLGGLADGSTVYSMCGYKENVAYDSSVALLYTRYSPRRLTMLPEWRSGSALDSDSKGREFESCLG